MKPACYADEIVNPVKPICLKGSPWLQNMAIPLLIGQLQNELITIFNDDNSIQLLNCSHTTIHSLRVPVQSTLQRLARSLITQ